MKNRKRKVTCHHLIPTSRGGYNVRSNMYGLISNKHEALHTLFANLAPHEQIMFLMDLNSSVFSARFKANMWEVLSKDPRFIYKRGVCDINHLKSSMMYGKREEE